LCRRGTLTQSINQPIQPGISVSLGMQPCPGIRGSKDAMQTTSFPPPRVYRGALSTSRRAESDPWQARRRVVLIINAMHMLPARYLSSLHDCTFAPSPSDTEISLAWLGRAVRMEECRLPKNKLIWDLSRTSRKTGRPWKNWQDIIRKIWTVDVV